MALTKEQLESKLYAVQHLKDQYYIGTQTAYDLLKNREVLETMPEIYCDDFLKHNLTQGNNYRPTPKLMLALGNFLNQSYDNYISNSSTDLDELEQDLLENQEELWYEWTSTFDDLVFCSLSLDAGESKPKVSGMGAISNMFYPLFLDENPSRRYSAESMFDLTKGISELDGTWLTILETRLKSNIRENVLFHTNEDEIFSVLHQDPNYSKYMTTKCDEYLTILDSFSGLEQIFNSLDYRKEFVEAMGDVSRPNYKIIFDFYVRDNLGRESEHRKMLGSAYLEHTKMSFTETLDKLRQLTSDVAKRVSELKKWSAPKIAIRHDERLLLERRTLLSCLQTEKHFLQRMFP